MDLRAMLNADGGAGGHRARTAHPPAHPQSTSTSSATAAAAVTATPVQASPGTPVQTAPPPRPPRSFHDYSHSTHASPVSQPREYPPPGHPNNNNNNNNNNPSPAGPGPAPYASPGAPYPGRPSAPPLQPLAPHDVRSPGSASLSVPSPYRHTPTSSTSVGSTGYPFPPTQQPPASPIQRHQYGPPSSHSRDSYSSQPVAGPGSYPQSQQQHQHQHQQPQQPPPPPPLQHHHQHHQHQQQPQLQLQIQQQQQHHPQQQQSVPPTPPVGTPGGNHQYMQQRSLSLHSTPTPTATPAHGHQPHYIPSYAQGSPVAAHAPPPPGHFDQHHHQHQSPQPATPLRPSMTAPRQSPAISHQQPSSPYQQRMPSTAAPYPQPMKTSPPPPPPASLPRIPSTGHNSYDAVSESQRRSQSQQSRSERDRSMSVSPKTRLPSVPSTTGQPISNEQDPFQSQQRLPPHLLSAVAAKTEPQRDMTPAKRKIDDRDLRPDEVENPRQPPPPPKMNGNHAPPSQRSSTSPAMSRKRRIMHSGPPVWAQSGRKRMLTASRNFSIKQQQHVGAAPGSMASLNGAHHEPSSAVKAERVSRHTSPEMARSTTFIKEEPGPDAVKDALTFGGHPFPWEATIEGPKPIDFVSRAIADFFVFNVLQGPNPAELRARGAQFEIEAKLGTLIDKSTNDRVELRIQAGECVMGEGGRIAFRSSMTENQHRVLNEYLNEQVKASVSPRGPMAPPRVPIQYVHRRQTDRFFELPAHLRQRLPPWVANLLSPNAPLKARITYDQKTGNVLAKIVKARVADLHIHMAHMPLDCRISINIEWDWDGPPQEIMQNQIPNKDRQPDRNKDRLSYTHGFYQIDLTQVTQELQGRQEPAGSPPKDHELEIELESRVLYEHGHLLMKGEPNRYTDLVDGLIDNVRVLARHCPQPTM
ncbi:CYTH-like domain-containing protein [Nemania sp. NC0429]|nr:CYTH-like domain-containing protein [Nemania sp. NC0429]